MLGGKGKEGDEKEVKIDRSTFLAELTLRPVNCSLKSSDNFKYQ